MKDMGILKRFLGLDIARNSNGDVILSQQHYLEQILVRFGMQDCKPAYTPLPHLRLHKRDYDPDDIQPPADQTLYREIIGSINHAAVWTRPDISHAISILSQYLHDPAQVHLNAAKHLLRYLKGTLHYRQIYSGTKKSPKLVGYADADYANDEDDRKSYSGYCYFLFNNSAPISYSFKKQSLVAQSTMESETIALSHAAKEGLWFRNLCHDLGIFGEQSSPVPAIFMINSNSDSALKVIKNPVFHARTKHFDVRHHFIRDISSKGEVTMGFVPGEDNPADIFTKGLERIKHAAALRLLHMA
jgi:hypothetical protein